MNEQDLEQKVDSPSGTMPVWSVCLFVGVVGTGLIGYLEWHVHLQKQREQEARYEAESAYFLADSSICCSNLSMLLNNSEKLPFPNPPQPGS